LTSAIVILARILSIGMYFAYLLVKAEAKAEAIKAAIKREKIKARFESSERKQTRPKGQEQNKLNQKYN